MIVNCIDIANNILDKFKSDLEKLKKKKIIPHMAIVKINDDAASDKYVSIKLKKAAELGVKTTLISEGIKTQDDLIKQIHILNNDDSIDGYIIQLPLPKGFDSNVICEHIDVNKDIDGLSSFAISRNLANSNLFHPKPCTANGIIEILKQSNYSIEGKHAVIINRSMIVGKPLIGLFLENNATVTVCHTKTQNLKEMTKTADIVVIAIGKPDFLTKDMVNPNAFVIDAGISVVDGKVVGDAAKDLQEYVKYITPVPNGVGRLTVAMIFKNLMDLVKEKYNERI